MADKKSKDSLGDRQKQYEAASSSFLTRRIPVIIRIDGRAFSKFCKRFAKPYDSILHDTLNSVTTYLCKNIQGAKFAERHSDEISILVTDYDDINTSAFFDYNVQKICSIVSSMATAEFCRLLFLAGPEYLNSYEEWPSFDARCFNIPEGDIKNYFLWRIQDSIRNSISMVAQSKFSHKELMGVSNSEKQEMLFKNFGINWAKLPQGQKSGFVFRKTWVNEVQSLAVIKRYWECLPCPQDKADWMSIIDTALTKKEE